MSHRRISRDLARSVQPAFEQLQLPWLCPALYTASRSRPSSQSRPPVQRRSTATATAAAAARRPQSLARTQTSPASAATVTQNLRPRRQYANATAPATAYYSPEDDLHVPIVSNAGVTGSSSLWSQASSDLPAFDPANPLILDISPKRQGDRLRSHQSLWSSSDLRDAHQTLEACLTVGLHSRAAATLRYLNGIYKPGSPEITGLNNYYIGHLLGSLITTGEPDILQEVAKWYHVDMLKNGVRPDAATYALMIQVVMRDPSSSRAGRSVRRFANAAQDAGVLEAVKEELGNAVPVEEYRQIIDMAPSVFSDVSAALEQSVQQDPEALADDVPPFSELYSSLDTTAKTQHVPILDTVQKGTGLQNLRRSLLGLRNQETQPRKEETSDNYNLRRQRRLEDDVKIAALEKFETDMEQIAEAGVEQPVLKSSAVQKLLRRWHANLVPLLKSKLFSQPESLELPTGSNQEPSARLSSKTRSLDHLVFLQLLNAEKISTIAITTLINRIASERQYDYVTVANAAIEIARNIEVETAKAWIHSRKMNRFTKAASKRMQTRNVRDLYQHMRHYVPDGLMPPEWSKIVHVKVGATILEEVLKVTTLEPDAKTKTGGETPAASPALFQKLVFRRGRKNGVIMCSTELKQMLASTAVIPLLAKNQPMLIPPKPWSGFRQGAYLNDGVRVVRLSTETFQSHEYIKVAVENGDMKELLKGLDVLGKVPWKVNRNVYDVFLKIWNLGQGFNKIPPVDPQVEMPEPPPADANLSDRIRHSFEVKTARDKLAGQHAERCFQNFQLETARAFLDDVFYLPHNIDFRGRAYPVPPYLNQMGADHCRGLLLFGEGKELGQTGLKWLKVHLANLYGYDKASLSERESFADEHMEQVLDSANLPLEGQQWWTKAEDPWQCLATCFELRNALELADPTKYVSHLPVHQDGTCNGLQHYAALGGDIIGAQQVNLEPGDRPSDIYTAVANHVRESVVADAATGNPYAQELKDKIVRKVVKQPVMTSVYGVTYAGARDQIIRQLQALYPDSVGQSRELSYKYANYLAHKTFSAMGAIFSGASAIQDWLGDSAGRVCRSVSPDQIENLKAEITKNEINATAEALSAATPAPSKKTSLKQFLRDEMNFRSTIIWTTPLRMPVVQPYRAAPPRRIKTGVQDVSLDCPTDAHQVDRRKQLQAFPPNYIHSLDATHMLLSALRCEQAGLTFAAVHDSFWTHASDIDTMNVALRDTFVQMHQEDIIGRLASEFKTRYSGYISKQRVNRKSPLGKRLLKHRREHGRKTRGSSRDVDELLLEHERQQLLNSQNPELRQKGADMVTAGSICLEAAEEDWKCAEEMEEPDEDLAEEGGAEEGLDTVLGSPFAAPTGSEILDEVAELQDAKSADEPAPTLTTPDEAWKRPKKAKKATWHNYLNVWVPLTFAEVPKKGAWDVSRLKESKYFFS